MKSWICTECKKACKSRRARLAHFRHQHTNYDELYSKKREELKECKGITSFSKKLFLKNYARTHKTLKKE